MAKKNSTHIRTYKSDKEKWAEMCKTLGTPSPELFNKVMTSENINLNKRVLEELQKKEQALKRKMGIKDVL